ncbi:efflux RND transporter periplasmic adaptor subunit [Lichenibacterium dinghuense]|uniref:efflux RND transporter periplasmic adaptor subunit n=1 Tax=Lichenibacterium dinghuense TaxID=2895977 RepID=UPI001F0214E6|nr:efflux RND transporter periplasmic adaptor subunit [Lichenibacterium sp. 6Y81]
MRTLFRFLVVLALIVGAAVGVGAFVPASRPALRAGLDRAGLGAEAARWLPADRAAPTVAAAPLPPAVSVVRAANREFRDRLSVSGTLVAREEAMVGPQIDGLRITELLADDGDRVAKGQVLARLDRSQLDALAAQSDAALARADAAVAQAQNAIQQFTATDAQAQADYSRATRLESGVISQSALDSRASAARASTAQLAGARSALAVAEADRRAQQANRRELDVRIGRTEVRAPVAGVVSRRSARLGALSSSGGDALFRITEDGAVDLDAEVPEDALARVRLGMGASVKASGASAAVPGTVRLISSEIDRASRLGHVRIALGADPAARIGAFATGVIAISKRDGVAVPASALAGQDGDWSVDLVGADNRIVQRAVERGLSDGAEVEITGGLAAGDRVVARAAAFLRAGDLVRPLPLDVEASR